jgi:hypothetical protein
VESMNVVYERSLEIRRIAHQHPLPHRGTTPTRKGFFLCFRTCHASIERNRTNDQQPNPPPDQHRVTAATQEAAELSPTNAHTTKTRTVSLGWDPPVSHPTPDVCPAHTLRSREDLHTTARRGIKERGKRGLCRRRQEGDTDPTTDR